MPQVFILKHISQVWLSLFFFCKPINEDPYSSVCESINEISEQEIENSKKDLNSKFTNIDYDTYIKQFWVGLLGGDGTITISCPIPNHVKVRMFISIKNAK